MRCCRRVCSITLSFSTEDARRTELYRQRDAAERLRAETTSMEDYYRSLEMTVHLSRVSSDNLARASQMTQKTTQFNTTTRLYSETDLEPIRQDDDWKTLVMRVVGQIRRQRKRRLAAGPAQGRLL